MSVTSVPIMQINNVGSQVKSAADMTGVSSIYQIRYATSNVQVLGNKTGSMTSVPGVGVVCGRTVVSRRVVGTMTVTMAVGGTVTVTVSLARVVSGRCVTVSAAMMRCGVMTGHCCLKHRLFFHNRIQNILDGLVAIDSKSGNF